MKEGFDVVTGGAGFIGSHICRALLRQGRRVRIIDNLLSGKLDNVADIRQRFGAKCEIFEQDVCDLEGLMNLFKGADTVYHQAALTSVQKSLQNPLETNSTNVDGTLKVLLAARDRGIRKVVFATSTSVYGDSDALPKREEMKPNPISPYAVTKYVGELYCKIFSEVYQLPTLGLRYFNVFGPSQNPDSEYAGSFLDSSLECLEASKPLSMTTGNRIGTSFSLMTWFLLIYWRRSHTPRACA